MSIKVNITFLHKVIVNTNALLHPNYNVTTLDPEGLSSSATSSRRPLLLLAPAPHSLVRPLPSQVQQSPWSGCCDHEDGPLPQGEHPEDGVDPETPEVEDHVDPDEVGKSEACGDGTSQSPEIMSQRRPNKYAIYAYTHGPVTGSGRHQTIPYCPHSGV